MPSLDSRTAGVVALELRLLSYKEHEGCLCLDFAVLDLTWRFYPLKNESAASPGGWAEPKYVVVVGVLAEGLFETGFESPLGSHPQDPPSLRGSLSTCTDGRMAYTWFPAWVRAPACQHLLARQESLAPGLHLW